MLYAFDATGATHCSAAPTTCTPLWTAHTAYFHGMTIADSIAYPYESDSKYPYTEDGNREFLDGKEIIEAFILASALCAATTTLRFNMFVLKLPIRPPALVARKLRSAGRLNRTVSTAWLLAGLAACGLGAAYLGAVWWHTWQTPNCYVALSYGCYTPGMLVTRVTAATAIAAAGAALLLGRWLAVRYAALTPSRRRFALRSRR